MLDFTGFTVHAFLIPVLLTAMSQALVPLFAQMGVEAVSVGVNSVTSPPAVPPIFRWKFKNASVIGLWHPGNIREFSLKIFTVTVY